MLIQIILKLNYEVVRRRKIRGLSPIPQENTIMPKIHGHTP